MLRFFAFFFLSHSFSVSAIQVNRIFIKGNKTTESSVIRPHISLKEKRTYRSSIVQRDVKNLLTLGFFDHIEVRTKKTSNNKINVTYFFKERYLIQQIEYKGNDNMDLEELNEASAVKSFQFLNFDRLQETFSQIKKKYKEKGYFLVDISYKIVPLNKNQKAKLIINIKENQRMLIKRIQFVGNRQVSSGTLKAFLITKEQNITSFFGNSGVYDPEALERDLQLIEYYYRDQGYLQIRLGKPEISITPDRKGIHIHLSIQEGSRFRLGQVEFKEDAVVSRSKVLNLLELKTGEYFSLGVLQRDIQKIQNLYKEKSYAFAQVQPRIIPDQREENTVHILLQVDKGSSYKVGHIKIKGNYKTRDKVILRQVFLKEGESYKESKKQLSANLIQRLGFFEKVDLNLKKINSKTADLHIDLKERERLGELNLSGGYNSLYKIFIKAAAKKINFLGLGHSVSVQLDVSRFQELFNFSYSNPYFLDTNWNLGMDVFKTNQDLLNNYDALSALNNQRTVAYTQLNTGASVSLGHHFSNFLTVFVKYKLQNQSLSGETSGLLRELANYTKELVGRFLSEDSEDEPEVTSPEPANPSDDSGVNFSDIYSLEEGTGVNSLLSGIVEYDRRNDRLFATGGYYGRFSFEYSGLGGDFHYSKIRANVRYYKKLFWKVVLRNNLNYGLVLSHDKSKKIPFTELFLLGGPDTLRGFKPFSIGTRRYSQNAYDYAKKNNHSYPDAFALRPYGGSQMFYWNVELQFPIMRSGVEAVAFFDLGEASDALTFNLSKELRVDAGVGIRWRSPLGPLRLDFGFPFKPRVPFGEEKMEFQFSMGASF